MPLKVSSVEATSSETSSVIELDLSNVPENKWGQAKIEVGKYLQEQILLRVADAKSPLDGKKFQKLDPDSPYKAQKKADGLPPIANLENTGAMLDSLTYKLEKGNKLKVGVFGSEAPKADGHVNFSGESKLPERRFIPGKGQTFDQKIIDGVDSIIQEFAADGFKKSDFRDIESSKELYKTLKEKFPGLSRHELKAQALVSDRILKILKELNLLDFL